MVRVRAAGVVVNQAVLDQVLTRVCSAKDAGRRCGRPVTARGSQAACAKTRCR